MGLIENIEGTTICVDTAPFIYFIEKNSKYFKLMKSIFSKIEDEKIDAITSTITLLEVLVLPLRLEKIDLAEQYRDILLNTDGLITCEISHLISELSANLRANLRFSFWDSVVVASALDCDASPKVPGFFTPILAMGGKNVAQLYCKVFRNYFWLYGAVNRMAGSCD